MHKLGLTIAICLASITCLGQSAVQANQLFEEQDYANALNVYKALLKKTPNNELYLYRYARCAQEMGQWEEALKYFNLAGDRYPLKYYYMGDVYMELWRTEEAVNCYETYADMADVAPERAEHLEKMTALAQKLQRYLKRVEEVHIIDSVCLPKKNFLKAYHLGPDAGQLTMDSAFLITHLSAKGDRRICAVNDSVMRLCTQYKLLDSWETLDTLSESINFADKINYPFTLSDGVTIYFAAEHPDGFGGYDIYISRYNVATNSYTHPENIGFPFNSPANDYMMAVDETNRIGYFATDRFTTTDSVCIYSFTVDEEKKYIRDIENDSIILFARMQKTIHADDFAFNPQSNKIKSVGKPKKEQIRFVLNDSVVYISTDEFLSDSSAILYEKYEETVQQLKEISNTLETLRKRYADAEETIRRELTPCILELEQKKEKLMGLGRKLQNDIRVLEKQEKYSSLTI